MAVGDEGFGFGGGEFSWPNQCTQRAQTRRSILHCLTYLFGAFQLYQYVACWWLFGDGGFKAHAHICQRRNRPYLWEECGVLQAHDEHTL